MIINDVYARRVFYPRDFYPREIGKGGDELREIRKVRAVAIRPIKDSRFSNEEKKIQ
jgi:hypothetical protein